MTKITKQQTVFFELLKAGLWEKGVSLSAYGEIDYSDIMRMAEEQSVVGLITAGLEHVVDLKVPQEWALQFIGQTLQIEQRNKAMNEFVAGLIGNLRKEGVYALLVKGQGIAQCYERPLWRAAGDVDLLLDKINYERAKSVLIPLSRSIEDEEKDRLHQGIVIDEWLVELHGTLNSRINKTIDYELMRIQDDTFKNGKSRAWKYNNNVLLAEANNDIVFIFAHIIQHYFKGGIGLRQICDWCRLIWIYSSEIDIRVLEERIKRMGLLTEWKVFAALAVNFLGMQKEIMPLYDDAMKWKNKACKVLPFVLEVGNFGHNRDSSYYNKYPYLVYKAVSLGRHIMDFIRYARVFPLDAINVSFTTIGQGIKAVKNGK